MKIFKDENIRLARLSLSLAVISLGIVTNAFAYKPALHQEFSEQAWLQATNGATYAQPGYQFTLGGIKLSKFGPEFESSELPYLAPRSLVVVPVSETDYVAKKGGAAQVLSFGAMWEDEKPASIWSKRPFNHFYDIQNNRGLTLELPLWKVPGTDEYTTGNIIPAGADVILQPGPILGNRSVDWALEDRGNAQTDFGTFTFEDQKYSYRDAREYFYKALIAGSRADRLNHTANMFQSLGHILHHVQDMGQPQHVRNDMHCDACGTLNDISMYEAETGKSAEFIRRLVLKSAYSYSRAVILDHPRDYWEHRNGYGMAQYTARNFISTESNFRLKPVQNRTENLFASLQTHQNFPQPSISSLYIKEDSFENAARNSTLPIDGDLINRLKGVKIKFIGKKVTDALTGETVNLDKLATVSAFGNDFSTKYALLPDDMEVASVNQLNYGAHIDALFPRIIAFSEGLLRFFFRIQLDVEMQGKANNGYSLKIKNKTVHDLGKDRSLDGTFVIMTEDASGKRTILRNAIAKLAEDEEITLEGVISGTPAAVVVAFIGKQGAEGSNDALLAVGGGYGRFIPHVPDVTWCAQASADGGKSVTVNMHQLGSRAGRVNVYYNMYSVPDELIVVHGNTVVASTGEFVAGSGTLTFNYDPALHNNNDYVMVWVNAPQDGTQWTYSITCPF